MTGLAKEQIAQMARYHSWATERLLSSVAPLPEQDYIVVSYAGQIAPILPLPDGIGTGSALAQGDVFAVSGGGAVASVGYDRWLYVNGQRMTVSPSSEFGLHPNLSVGDLVWSPDGQRLAFRVSAVQPHSDLLCTGIYDRYLKKRL